MCVIFGLLKKCRQSIFIPTEDKFAFAILSADKLPMINSP